ncbi:MAG: zinc ribbon domain-containing protein [Gemmatimonadetes bacterium]|nr:zinc ribbon domain-containing protein [Gemmatimonadota bacterium]
MPTYAHRCLVCDGSFEIRQSIADHDGQTAPPCPHCGSAQVTRSFTSLNVITHAGDGPAAPPRCGPSSGPGCCG